MAKNKFYNLQFIQRFMHHCSFMHDFFSRYFFPIFSNCAMHLNASCSISSVDSLRVVVDRGMLRSLWVGVLIALPSGAGVALSILGGNTGSLVGVAISASLLPPAVNAVSYSFVTTSEIFNNWAF